MPFDLASRLMAGQLRKRVVLQRRVPSTDSEGSSKESWTAIQPIWAQVSPAGAIERQQAAQAEVQATHQVTIRWRPDVARVAWTSSTSSGHDMRLLLDGGRVLDIQTVSDPDERHQQLNLLCLEHQI